MSNIHVAKLGEDGEYETPVPILGAKSVECTFDVSEKAIYADNRQVYNARAIAQGSGSLELLGLTPDERRLLSGDEGEVGFKLGTDVRTPSFALLFEMEKGDSKKVMYCIYNVSFNPQGISATAVEDGIEEQTVSLDFVAIAEEKQNLFFFAIDTAEEAEGIETLAQNWYTQVQLP